MLLHQQQTHADQLGMAWGDTTVLRLHHRHTWSHDTEG